MSVGAAEQLLAWQGRLEALLAEAVGPSLDGLRAAMAYALLGEGKRLRPLMVLAAAAAVQDEPTSLAWRAAVGVECVHAYSLVHDDLPAMDDDDLRRGRPTVHRAFDEATAILTGDALQALAFDRLGASEGSAAEARRALRLVAELAQAAGGTGMVAGQYLDLRLAPTASEAGVREMHGLKTGALFRAATRMGAIAAGAGPAALGRLSRFGEAFGVMYQALDDLADEAGDAGRPSLVHVLGREGTLGTAAAAAESARAVAASFGRRGGPLAMLVERVTGAPLGVT